VRVAIAEALVDTLCDGRLDTDAAVKGDAVGLRRGVPLASRDWEAKSEGLGLELPSLDPLAAPMTESVVPIDPVASGAVAVTRGVKVSPPHQLPLGDAVL
jgi:hypothetical protein